MSESVRGSEAGRKHPLYSRWAGMLYRCHSRNGGELYWGPMGVTVCDRWRFGEGGKHPFDCFLADVGECPGPGYSIDRFPDKAGPYAPDNFRWATASQQNANLRKRGTSQSFVWTEMRQRNGGYVSRAKRKPVPSKT